jgi:hypothetical protein
MSGIFFGTVILSEAKYPLFACVAHEFDWMAPAF